MINSADSQQRHLFEILFEHAPMGLAIIDQHKMVRRCNAVWGKMVRQYVPDASISSQFGTTLPDLLPGSKTRLLPLFNRAANGEVVEYKGLRLNHAGVISVWDLTLAPFPEDAGSRGVLCILIDVTKPVKVQQDLVTGNDNNTRPRQQPAMMGEGDRLARVLHDRLAQALGAIKIRAALAQQQLEANRPDLALASVEALKQITNDTYTDVREAIFNLRTDVFGGQNFVLMLHSYLDGFEAQSGIDTRLVIESNQLEQLSAEVGRQLLRIVQEALSNVRKHAQARQVTIHFADDGIRLAVEIMDNGTGFKPGTPNLEGQLSFGLDIMRERAASVGGDLTIASTAGGGVTVKISIPLE